MGVVPARLVPRPTLACHRCFRRSSSLVLAARRAFPGNTPADAMSAVLTQDSPQLPVIEKQIPAALERIVSRCLEKTPALRFQTVSDLVFALDGLCGSS